MNKRNSNETKLKKINDVVSELVNLVTQATMIVSGLITLVIQAKTLIDWFGN